MVARAEPWGAVRGSQRDLAVAKPGGHRARLRDWAATGERGGDWAAPRRLPGEARAREREFRRRPVLRAGAFTMASAELDYTIEIPDQPCWSQENSPNQGGKEAGTRQPLVILLGWGGCTDKNLAKYSAIYHKRGCIVIRYTAPWHMVFFSESLGIPSLRVLAQKLLELLFDYEVEKEPLLFHVFSNAGVMLYRYVLELLQTHRRFCHLRVVGTIFDSGPGDSNVLGALRALAAVLEHRPAVLRLLLLAAFALVAVLFHVLLAPLTALFHTHFYDRLLDAASRWPELYLYSRADEVVLARDVERMVEARLAHQVLVRSVDFVSSAHVSHLRDYPTYYTSLCVDFMRSCVHC
ncbi:transmembrane protein 53 isoform X1 [Enhydra lutris kenyoni]|uniref:Transmembrane protein 53 isoform X1 n=1 Tax=Enhydra lutris kenyoni TaxID=391180 RepID=A0A2Y9J5L3_ENHLU|nr:transmembrane protein 53 isoform X1 [Enhydra lutris kenyoni]